MNKLNYLKNMNVLLAEDDEIIAKSLINVLSIFVKNVYLAKNGQEAINLYNMHDINIIILDIEMPHLNGIEVAKEIRKKDMCTPIFISTAFNDTKYLHNAIPLMLCDYLIKPLNFEQIKNTLLKCLEYIDKQGLLIIQIDKNCTYNTTTGEIKLNNEEKIILPKNEKKLLDILLKNKNQLVTKEYLENEIFEMDYSDSSLKNLVYRLKKRLNLNIIVSIKDLGYMISSYEDA